MWTHFRNSTFLSPRYTIPVMDSGTVDDMAKTSDGAEVRFGGLEKCRRRTRERLAGRDDKIPLGHQTSKIRQD